MGPTQSRFLNVAVIPILSLAVLLLPPVSVPTRVAEIGYQRLDKAGATISADDGMQVSVPPGAIAKNIPIKVDVVPRLDFQKQAAGDTKAAAAAFSTNLNIVSPVYAVDTRGNGVSQASISVPIPNGVELDSLRSVDAYGWNGTRWQWLPSRPVVGEDRIQVTAQPMPQAVALVRSAEVKQPVVSAWLPVGRSVDTGAQGLVAELNPLGLAINTDGTVMGEVGRSQWSKDDKYLIVPSLQNKVGDSFDADLASNVLQNSSLRRQLLQNVLLVVNTNLYAGLDLDVRGLGVDDRANFTAFVVEAARELHKSNKLLSVTLPAPVQVSDEQWATDGYDWVAVGRAADVVKVGVLSSPVDYLTRLDKTLGYAVSVIDRSKIQVSLSTYSQVAGDALPVEKAYGDVVKVATKIQLATDPAKPTLVSEPVNVSLPNLAEGPTWDAQAKATRLAYRDGSTVQTVWLESGTSLAYKLRTVLDYRLRGIAIHDLLGDGNNPEVWDVVGLYAQSAPVAAADPAQGSVKVAWNVSGGQVQPGSGSATWASIIWKAPEKEGSYTVSASISERPGSGVSTSSGASLDVKMPTPTPTPPPATPTPVPQPTATPRAQVAAAPAPAAVANPGFGYGVQAHMLGNDKNRVAAMTAGMGFGWIKQQVEWRDIEPSKGSYNWGGLDEVVAIANSKGIRVMFSVLRSPAWASGHPDSPPRNFNDYGDFIGALAARYKGKGMAYEVWNEQNLKREWHEYPIDACKYVELLKIGYTRIKNADPSAVVVAGALTPTGVNDPNIAVDDRTYLNQLYACGIRGWFDALGAHPSGFNNPPDVDWRTWADPARPSFKGHPSFFFKATMEDYRNIMVANGDGGRPIWITEFGWAVGSSIPGYEYAPQNSEGERAAWFVKAYQMSKNWGFVGVVFLWNLDFRIVAPGSEQALFGILDGGWGATPSYAALRDMPK